LTLAYWFLFSGLVVALGALTWAYTRLTLDHQKLIQEYRSLHDAWRSAVEANMQKYLSQNDRLWLNEISQPEAQEAAMPAEKKQPKQVEHDAQPTKDEALAKFLTEQLELTEQQEAREQAEHKRSKDQG
jgi:hypothetical protein